MSLQSISHAKSACFGLLMATTAVGVTCLIVDRQTKPLREEVNITSPLNLFEILSFCLIASAQGRLSGARCRQVVSKSRVREQNVTCIRM
jgi:hypothetical protein